MGPLVSGRVDLQPHPHIEQPLGPVTGPDQVVERRQQGRAGDLARQARVGCQIRGLPPALHRHGRQLPRLDQLRDPVAGVGQRQAEIVPQIRRRGDPHGLRRNPHQVANGVRLGRCRQVDDPGGQGALGQVIDALEAVAGLCGDQPGPEQPLQRPLAVRPGPPAGGPARTFGEVAARDRPAPLDLGQDPIDIVALLASEPRQACPHRPAPRPLHAPAQQRLGLERQERRLVSPVFEQAGPRAPGFGLQRLARIIAQPREGRQIVGSRHHIDAVDLNHAELARDVADMAAARRRGLRSPEPLGGKRDAARGFQGEGFVHGTTMPRSPCRGERAGTTGSVPR